MTFNFSAIISLITIFLISMVGFTIADTNEDISGMNLSQSENSTDIQQYNESEIVMPGNESYYTSNASVSDPNIINLSSIKSQGEETVPNQSEESGGIKLFYKSFTYQSGV